MPPGILLEMKLYDAFKNKLTSLEDFSYLIAIGSRKKTH